MCFIDNKKIKKFQGVLVDCQLELGEILRVKSLTQVMGQIFDLVHGSSFGMPKIWVVINLLSSNNMSGFQYSSFSKLDLTLINFSTPLSDYFLVSYQRIFLTLCSFFLPFQTCFIFLHFLSNSSFLREKCLMISHLTEKSITISHMLRRCL